MFKLIAVRPLDGCRKSALKCLKEGQIYYLCNDYIISQDGISYRNKYVRPLPKDFFSIGKGSSMQVNISAIVGMNGDGKSALVELMMRLINNCAQYYKLKDKKNHLLRVDGVKAELYYELDDIIYCIRESKEDTYTGLYKYADLSNREAKEWQRQMIPVSRRLETEMLFYSIISNYSHYAYNTNDFKDEWTENLQETEVDRKCWLYYLFHKNDGYLTPITIHPYRKVGNIDINRETDLTIQRLTALYIQEASPSDNKYSFRRIGQKDAELLRLTDPGYSKLQEVTIHEYFKNAKSVSSLSKYIKLIEELVDKPDEIRIETLYDNDLEVIEDCLDFLTGVNDQEYQEFLNTFYGWVSPHRDMYTSKSDIRLLLRALQKFRNKVNSFLPYERFSQKYKRYDKLNVRNLVRLRYIYAVMRSWEIPTNILLINYGELSDVERSQHYIVYKTISICETYPEFRDYLDEAASAWNNNGLVIDDQVVYEVVNRIKADGTHVSLKLRQCVNFIAKKREEGVNVYEELNCSSLPQSVRSFYSDSLLVRFDDLKMHYNKQPFPLDYLPPAIYKTEILYQSTTHPDIYIPFGYLSSGEKQMLNNFGALIYHLRNLDSVSGRLAKYENVNIILEEIELYFHPDYQRRIVKSLLDKLQGASFRSIKRINITFVTHSPFILSDIPLCNVLFLSEGKPYDDKVQENTFGANIHGLLKNGFFLPSLPIGDFAHEHINMLFEKLNGFVLEPESEEQREWFYSNIMRVGEPYLREQLMKLFNMHFSARRNKHD